MTWRGIRENGGEPAMSTLGVTVNQRLWIVRYRGANWMEQGVFAAEVNSRWLWGSKKNWYDDGTSCPTAAKWA